MGGKLRSLGWYRRRQQEAGSQAFVLAPAEAVIPDYLRDEVEAGDENPKALHWGRPGPGVPQCPKCASTATSTPTRRAN